MGHPWHFCRWKLICFWPWTPQYWLFLSITLMKNSGKMKLSRAQLLILERSLGNCLCNRHKNHTGVEPWRSNNKRAVFCPRLFYLASLLTRALGDFPANYSRMRYPAIFVFCICMQPTLFARMRCKPPNVCYPCMHDYQCNEINLRILPSACALCLAS